MHGSGDREALKVKQSAASTATVHLTRDGDATVFHVHGGGLVISRMVNEFGIAKKQPPRSPKPSRGDRDARHRRHPAPAQDPALLDEFFTDAVAAVEQAQKADGNLGTDALADADNAWWSVTAWLDRPRMRALVDSQPHLGISERLDHYCDEATFADWEQDGPTCRTGRPAGATSPPMARSPSSPTHPTQTRPEPSPLRSSHHPASPETRGANPQNGWPAPAGLGDGQETHSLVPDHRAVVCGHRRVRAEQSGDSDVADGMQGHKERPARQHQRARKAPPVRVPAQQLTQAAHPITAWRLPGWLFDSLCADRESTEVGPATVLAA
jgi:hypothetical protein